MIDREIVFRHPGGGEALFKTAPHASAAERENARQRVHRLINAIDDRAGNTRLHDFFDRAAAEGENRRAASHGLDHHQSERLRPVNREQEGQGPAKKLTLAALIDFAEKLDTRLLQQRGNLLVKISFIHAVDFGSNLERNANSARDLNGAVRPVFRRYAPEKREIASARAVARLEQVGGDAVMNGCDEIAVSDPLP